MRLIELAGEFHTNWIKCPITPEVEAAVEAANKRLRELEDDAEYWTGGISVEVTEADGTEDPTETWVYETADEAVAAIQEWVNATA